MRDDEIVLQFRELLARHVRLCEFSETRVDAVDARIAIGDGRDDRRRAIDVDARRGVERGQRTAAQERAQIARPEFARAKRDRGQCDCGCMGMRKPRSFAQTIASS